jgi:arylsulfatase A-like enzyme
MKCKEGDRRAIEGSRPGSLRLEGTDPRAPPEIPSAPIAMTPRRPLTARLVPLLPLLLLLAGGCRENEERLGTPTPLLDGSAVPDVLTEGRRVALPPSLAGNRFLGGWWAWRDGEKRTILAPRGTESRLELVSLDGRPRTLVLDLTEAAPGKFVQVTAGGRRLGSFPLTDPLEIPLPAELPIGRLPIGLSFDADSPGVVDAAPRSALEAGEVRIAGRDVVQAGSSIVDLYARVPRNQVLVGSFVPPARPRAGQRFDLTLERADGTPIRRFSWSPSLWNRFRGERPIQMAVRDNGGVVRVRLLALGGGPPARWRGLGFASGIEGTGGIVSGVLAERDLTPEVAPSEPSEPLPRPAKAGLPPPSIVVLYVLDALRADAVGHLGGPKGVSPTLDRLAAGGVTFKAHRSVAPNTLPSTKALLTGRPFVARGGWQLAPEDGPTLAEAFRAAGYRTALFSGNSYVGPAFGTDRGFDTVAELPIVEGAAVNDNAARVEAAALAWLATLPPGAKAFLYLHVIHPHNPYSPPEPFRSRFTAGIPSAIDGRTETLMQVKLGKAEATLADRQRIRGLYHGSLAFADDRLGVLLQALRQRMPASQLLVAVTADHGEELFDHGGMLHGFTLYEEQLRIPLVLWSPGRLVHGVSEQASDNLDTHATLRALAGLPPAPGSPGRDLLSRPKEPAPGTEIRFAAASSVKGGMYTARSPRIQLIWAPRAGLGWGMGEGIGRSYDPELVFDLERDPKEANNLAGSDLDDLEPAWLKAKLLAWIERNGGREGEEKAVPVDAETTSRLRALGYVN